MLLSPGDKSWVTNIPITSFRLVSRIPSILFEAKIIMDCTEPEWHHPSRRVRALQTCFCSPVLPTYRHPYSTLLKSDQWYRESHQVLNGVRGAINFRNIPGTQIYALGQPTLDAIDEVVARVKEAHPTTDRVLWITLREEPIVYINGVPYCLRRERFTLRNMKGNHRSYRRRSLVANDVLP